MGRHVCNVRRSVSAVQKEFAHWDFSGMASDEDDQYQRYGAAREPPDALVMRAMALLQFLRWADI